MTRSENQLSGSLEEAVATLLDQLHPTSIERLIETQEDQLSEIQSYFAEQLCDHWDMEEEDLLVLCAAPDLDTAASRLIRATWSQARTKMMH